MTLYCLGSINEDIFYQVPHLPAPGETLTADTTFRGLGGKGANMSVAAARAAAHVVHIGAVGADGAWARSLLLEYGVDTRHIVEVDEDTTKALIMVDTAGENAIVLTRGANWAIQPGQIGLALAEASPGDWLLIQNETSQQVQTARMGRDLALRVAYAAAPFSARAVSDIIEHIDLLILNAVEAAQLTEATGQTAAELPVDTVIVTRGADGIDWFDNRTGKETHIPAVPVVPVDTTGAGDTLTGYLIAGLDRGMPMEQALTRAVRAAAIMVTRHGTADVIPDLKDLEAFRQD